MAVQLSETARRFDLIVLASDETEDLFAKVPEFVQGMAMSDPRPSGRGGRCVDIDQSIDKGETRCLEGIALAAATQEAWSDPRSMARSRERRAALDAAGRPVVGRGGQERAEKAT